MQPPDRKPETICAPNTICVPIGRGPPPPSETIVARAAGPRESASDRAGRASSTMPCIGQSASERWFIIGTNFNPSARFQKPDVQTLARSVGLRLVISRTDGMSISVSKLGLAAAQFGLDGSGSAPRGRSPEVETREILNIAARARLSVLDASGLFGRAETILG